MRVIVVLVMVIELPKSPVIQGWTIWMYTPT